MTVQRKPELPPKRLTVWGTRVSLLAAAILVILGIFAKGEIGPGTAPERVFTPGGELRLEHDEAIMLLVSLAVIIEIVTNFNFVRLIPHRNILLCSFFAFVLAAVFTVAEGFFFKNVLNFGEHLLLAASAILLAIWCARMFAVEKREGT